jgi:hypothetical protein
VDKENSDPKREEIWKRKEEADRSLLQQSIFNFIANLCVEKSLRLTFSADPHGIISGIHSQFRKDIETKPFDWIDMVAKELAIFINISGETQS